MAYAHRKKWERKRDNAPPGTSIVGAAGEATHIVWELENSELRSDRYNEMGGRTRLSHIFLYFLTEDSCTRMIYFVSTKVRFIGAQPQPRATLLRLRALLKLVLQLTYRNRNNKKLQLFIFCRTYMVEISRAFLDVRDPIGSRITRRRPQPQKFGPKST